MAEASAERTGSPACRIQFVSHGSRIEIHVDDAALLRPVRDLLPPGSRETDLREVDARYEIRRTAGGDDYLQYTVLRDGEPILREGALPYAIMVLANGLHYGVARNSPSHLFVHAGAVEWRGRVLLLPGGSRCGKSSLVDALVRHGATYYSDECAPVDEGARVRPYRKPLWLREDHPRFMQSAFRSSSRQHDDGDAMPVGLILFQEYVPTASWEPRPVMPGDALLRLAQQTPLAGAAPERTLQVLSRLVSEAPAYVTERPDADEVANLILQLMDNQSPGPVQLAGSDIQPGPSPAQRRSHNASEVS
jgi:hypothetical protein